MSIGKRISIIRKENGLSQEAFGSSINVTRQSISKWEADLTIPEVDKCIEISKKYNVSIEWLLGTRENREDEKTLNEEQLIALEDIVKKYTSSKSKKYQNTIIVFGFIIILIVTGMLFSEAISSISNRQNQIQVNIDEINDKVNEQNENLNKLEELLFNQQEIMINELTFNNHDYKNNTANLYINITPKEVQNNMNIKIHIDNGIETINQKAIKDNKNFIANIQVTLTDMMLISATIQTNTSEKTIYINEIENALKDSYYRAFDYQNYGFLFTKPNSSRITGLLVGNKLNKIQDLEIEQIKSYIFINSNFHSIEDTKVTYNSHLKRYTSETQIDVSNITKNEISVEVIDVITDSANRSYVIGGIKYSVNLSNKNNPKYKVDETYKVDNDFEWERYE